MSIINNDKQNQIKIFIGSDHAGYETKQKLINWLSKKFAIVDLGTNKATSVDYPDYGFLVAKNVVNQKNAIGIAICGTGVGMSIVVNKVKGIRGALIYDSKIANLAVEHDCANVICLGARVTSLIEMKKIIKIFLKSKFAYGRHTNRINKIIKYEKGLLLNNLEINNNHKKN